MSQLRFPKLTEITGYLLVSLVYGERSLREIFPNLAVIRGKELFLDYSLVIYENDGLQEINLPSLTTILDGGVRIEKNINLCYVKTIRWESIINSNNSLALGTNSNDCYDTCFGGKCKSPAGHGRSTRQYCWAPGDDAQNADCQSCKCHLWFLLHIFVVTDNFVIVNNYAVAVWPVTGQVFHNTKWPSRQSYILNKFYKSKKSIESKLSYAD